MRLINAAAAADESMAQRIRFGDCVHGRDVRATTTRGHGWRSVDWALAAGPPLSKTTSPHPPPLSTPAATPRDDERSERRSGPLGHVGDRPRRLLRRPVPAASGVGPPGSH